MNNLSVQTTTELLELRRKLDAISQISFSYSQFNKRFHIDRVTEDQGKQVIHAYKELLRSVINSLKSEYESEKSLETANDLPPFSGVEVTPLT